VSDRIWAVLGSAILIVGGALAVVGSLSRWILVTFAPIPPGALIAFAHVNRPHHHFWLGVGTGRLGHVTFYLGIACIILGMAGLAIRRRSRLVTLPAAAVGIAVVAITAWRAVSIFRFSDKKYVRVPIAGGGSQRIVHHTGMIEHVGVGIWITVVGGAVIVAAAFIGARRDSSAVVAVADR
jgi:hypothetical protein